MDSQCGLSVVSKPVSSSTCMPKQASGDATLYSEMDFLRLRNSFFKILEELRMRRCKDLENEAKISDLMKSEHKYLQLIEELNQKCASLEKSIAESKKIIREKFHEKQKHLEQEKAQLEAICSVKEKKFKSLTDEIRSLQMNKHTLENKIREKESVISTHNDSREVCMKQCQQLQHECAAIVTQVDQVFEQLELLKGNVTESVELNKKLSLVNSHQNCSIDELKQQLHKVTEELLQAKSTTCSAATNLSCASVNSDSQEPMQTTELDNLLQQKLDSLQQEHKATLLSLKEAHQLISKHINACNVAVDSKNILEERVNELLKSNEIIQTKLLQKQTQLEQLQEHQEMELVQHKSKVQDLLQRLVTLQTDFTTLQSSHDSLEGKLKETIDDKTDLKGKLNDYMMQNEELEQRINSLHTSKNNEGQSLEDDHVKVQDTGGQSLSSYHESSKPSLPISDVVNVSKISREITEMVVEEAIHNMEEAEGEGSGGEEVSLKDSLVQDGSSEQQVQVEESRLHDDDSGGQLDSVTVKDHCHHDNSDNSSDNCIDGTSNDVHPPSAFVPFDPTALHSTELHSISTDSKPMDDESTVHGGLPKGHSEAPSVDQSVTTCPPPSPAGVADSVFVPHQQLMFSDEEDIELQDKESMRSINRVQSYLNRDRLKRPRTNRI